MDQKLTKLKNKRMKLVRELVEINKVIASYNPHKHRMEMEENLDALRDVVPNFDSISKDLTEKDEIPTDNDEFMQYFAENFHNDDGSLIDELEKRR